MSDFKKRSDWAEILTTVSFHFFKNLLLLTIFSYLALLKSYYVEWKFVADCVIILVSHYKSTKTRRKSDFLPIKN
jgi:hypothetical protein